jgi:4-oxalocrotonate tautomerase
MPYVNIKITDEELPVSPEQKARLISDITQLLVDVIGRGPQTTVVVIEEIDTDNYGIGGKTVTALRGERK